MPTHKLQLSLLGKKTVRALYIVYLLIISFVMWELSIHLNEKMPLPYQNTYFIFKPPSLFLVTVAMRNSFPEFLAGSNEKVKLTKFILERIDISRTEGARLVA